MPKKSSKTVLPDPLPNGEVLTDITKNKWCLGPSIGVGGFGEIYSAAEYIEGSKKNLNYQYVVKIEPHGNGPLFCEMHFFMRNAKPDMIKNWCTERKITTLGIPRYLGSGSHECNGKKYRFLVMDKYGKDLWRLFLNNKRQFPVPTVYRIAINLLDALEYIHSNGYVHADLKGANILLGLTKQTQNHAFLVDFGLASRYTQKDFKPDPKKAHNGTIEYTSRDAHDGVPTRRGDIEILAYNLVQWMGCTLPWEKNLTDPVVVHSNKKKHMADVETFLSTCFGKKKVPGALADLLEYVSNMEYDTEPDYKKLRAILTKGLKATGGTLSGPLEFKPSSKHKSEEDLESETPEKRQKLTPARRTPRGKAVTETDQEELDAKPKPKGRAKKVVEKLSESESDNENVTPVKKTKARGRKVPLKEKEEDTIMIETNGYNTEMLRLKKKIAERNAVKPKKTKAKSNDSDTGRSEMNTPIESLIDDVIEATPPEKLSARRKNRNTPVANGYSDLETTPRTLRQRR